MLETPLVPFPPRSGSSIRLANIGRVTAHKVYNYSTSGREINEMFMIGKPLAHWHSKCLIVLALLIF